MKSSQINRHTRVAPTKFPSLIKKMNNDYANNGSFALYQNENALCLGIKNFGNKKLKIYVSGTIDIPIFYQAPVEEVLDAKEFLQIHNMFCEKASQHNDIYNEIRELEDKIRVLKGTIDEKNKVIWEEINQHLGSKVLSREQKRVLEEFCRQSSY